jgi:integrase
MSASTNVVRRIGSSSYYARMAVPKDLQKRLGRSLGKPKREFWKSLGTSDPREAKRRSRPVLDGWELEISELRRPRQLTEAELKDAIWKRYLEVITGHEKFRQSLPTEDQLSQIWAHLEDEFGPYNVDAYRILEVIRDQFEQSQRERTARIATLKADAARGETRAVANIVERIIEERRLDLERDAPEYRKLANGVQRAELEGLARAAERDGGDWAGEPKDRLVQPPNGVVHPPGETILELFDRCQAQSPGRLTADTWQQNRKIVALFDQFVGGSAHVSALNRKNVRDWKAKLFSWPVRAADTKQFAGLSFLKVIDKNKIANKPAISAKTINRYLSALGRFARWLLANDYLKENALAGMYLELDRSIRTRVPFNPKQLQAIFSSPLFLQCGGDKQEHLAGNVAVRDWRYWLPLIGLFTGARLGEIAQLLVADVRQTHGQWVFHITREGSATKSVKTAGSERVVPVHSALIKAGFLKYHQSITVRGDTKLFPEIEPDGRGFMSGRPSAFYADYFAEIGVKLDRSVNFHSFRHGIADAFRRASYLDEQFGMLLGHTGATTTGRYGILPEGILSERVKLIEAVAFPGLSLDHLSSS